MVDLLSLDEMLRYNVAIEQASVAAKPISMDTSGAPVPSAGQAHQPCFPQISSKGLPSMTARTKKSKLRDARLHLGLSQAEVGDRLGVTGAAIGHYETGVSRPSPDRAAQLARLLGLKPSEVSASERGSTRQTVDRPRRAAVKQAVSHAGDVKVPSRDEGAVLDALRAMPAAERRVMMKLVLTYGSASSRAVERRR